MEFALSGFDYRMGAVSGNNNTVTRSAVRICEQLHSQFIMAAALELHGYEKRCGRAGGHDKHSTCSLKVQN
jgi:hypothetical protein